jgi:hypothetical protein
MTKKIFYPLFLLLIPLIGTVVSDEVNWSLFDFVIMGFLLILLGVGINFVTTRSKNLKKQILYIGFIVLLFLAIWAELAVGVFGTIFAGS